MLIGVLGVRCEVLGVLGVRCVRCVRDMTRQEIRQDKDKRHT